MERNLTSHQRCLLLCLKRLTDEYIHEIRKPFSLNEVRSKLHEEIKDRLGIDFTIDAEDERLIIKYLNKHSHLVEAAFGNTHCWEPGVRRAFVSEEIKPR
jgi:hypothetical protein